MQYDVTLKRLLRHFAEQTLQQLSGSPIAWLPEELPKVQNLRMDLLGETAKHRGGYSREFRRWVWMRLRPIIRRY